MAFGLLDNRACWCRTKAGLNNTYCASNLKALFVFSDTLHSCKLNIETLDLKVALAWCFIDFMTFTSIINHDSPNDMSISTLNHFINYLSKKTVPQPFSRHFPLLEGKLKRALRERHIEVLKEVIC